VDVVLAQGLNKGVGSGAPLCLPMILQVGQAFHAAALAQVEVAFERAKEFLLRALCFYGAESMVHLMVHQCCVCRNGRASAAYGGWGLKLFHPSPLG